MAKKSTTNSKQEISKDRKIILVSNIGSRSRKYIVYESLKNKKEVNQLFRIEFDEKEFYPKVRLEDAMIEFFEIAKKEYGFNISDIDFIAERVVAVGEYFLENKIIDNKYLAKLELAKECDILHTEFLIHELKQLFSVKEMCQKKNIKCKFKIVGISDSAYHATIPEETFTYAIKKSKNEKDFRKYGYHGISMSEVSRNVKNKYKKAIAIHLGGGGSVTAMINGKSIYNSFGMTPVSGIINMTRSGDIDPYIAFHIYRKNKKNFTLLEESDRAFEKANREVYEESGLFALTGEKDMRDILANLRAKDKNIKQRNEFAINVYINKINECVGAAFANLGGCDALAMTGVILEKSDIFRSLLLKKLSWLNLESDRILVLKTAEEQEIVRLVIEGNFV